MTMKIIMKSGVWEVRLSCWRWQELGCLKQLFITWLSKSCFPSQDDRGCSGQLPQWYEQCLWVPLFSILSLNNPPKGKATGRLLWVSWFLLITIRVKIRKIESLMIYIRPTFDDMFNKMKCLKSLPDQWLVAHLSSEQRKMHLKSRWTPYLRS